jgi:hypothetical protein
MEFETWHIVIGIILIALLLCTRQEGYKNFCGNCHDLSLEQCANCPNCGVCKSDNGCKTCAQGDSAGPYFQNDCVDWEYMGKTPSNKCWNWERLSPYNCGYIYPYNKRVILHDKFAAWQNHLGTRTVELADNQEIMADMEQKQ